MNAYGIKHKATKKFFAGFDGNDQPVWTADMSKAWKDCRLAAECQASLLCTLDEQVQRKPVAAH
jgi:hypothetical protein